MGVVGRPRGTATRLQLAFVTGQVIRHLSVVNVPDSKGIAPQRGESCTVGGESNITDTCRDSLDPFAGVVVPELQSTAVFGDDHLPIG